MMRPWLPQFARATGRRMMSTTQPQQSLYMWGTDHHGSLCKPHNRRDEKYLDIPTRVEHLQDYMAEDTPLSVQDLQQVICGPTDTALLFSDGSCHVAGENKHGQLGVGHTQPVTKFTQLPLQVQSISLGPHTCGIVSNNGDLYTAGMGSSMSSGTGFLGQGEGNSCHTFQRVDSLVEDGCFARQVQMSEYHTTVLTTEGEVLSCGAGSYGRLGNFETNDQLYLEPVEIMTTRPIVKICGGKGFTLALSDDGVVYAWGRNHKGQLGLGFGLAVDMYAMQSVPEPIQADELVGRNVVQVAAGHSHAACITESGELFHWGMSLYLEPVRMDSLLHTKVVDVACGQDYTLAVGEDGKLYSFGQGQTLTSKRGVLGLGSVGRTEQAVWVEALEGKKVTQISAGWSHAACLVEDA